MTGQRGLFDGFEAYATPTDDDHRAVLTTGLVALDANVLLNLYRFSDETRDDLFDVLALFEDRLWVPHQAVAEFWRNREAVLRDPRERATMVRDLRKQAETATSQFRGWANRVSLAKADVEEVVAALEAGFATARERVEAVGADGDNSHDTAKDPVVARLGELLQGRVGPPFAAADESVALKEAGSRRDRQVPPGYADRKKADGGHGDYFVWEQVLREAAARKIDVLLVTSDTKEDWWRTEAGSLRGPRPELVRELRARAGTRLFLARPTDLLDLAKRLLSAEVSDTSLAEASRLDLTSAPELIATHVGRVAWEEDQMLRFVHERTGWTINGLRLLLAKLETEVAFAQADVIQLAARRGGFVGRFEIPPVFDGGIEGLGDFTEPIANAVRELKRDGHVAPHAIDLLEAVKDTDGSVQGFQFTDDLLVPLVRRAA